MGKIINLGTILNYAGNAKAPISLDLPDTNDSLIIVYYPKKYTTNNAIDYKKIEEDGFNTVMLIKRLGDKNILNVEVGEGDTFDVVVQKFTS